MCVSINYIKKFFIYQSLNMDLKVRLHFVSINSFFSNLKVHHVTFLSKINKILITS